MCGVKIGWVESRQKSLRVKFYTSCVLQTCAMDLERALPIDPEVRPWWASTVIPFGANLVLLVHGRNNSSPLYVRLYWNEQAIPHPASNDSIDCELSDFVVIFQQLKSTDLADVLWGENLTQARKKKMKLNMLTLPDKQHL